MTSATSMSPTSPMSFNLSRLDTLADDDDEDDLQSPGSPMPPSPFLRQDSILIKVGWMGSGIIFSVSVDTSVAKLGYDVAQRERRGLFCCPAFDYHLPMPQMTVATFWADSPSSPITGASAVSDPYQPDQSGSGRRQHSIGRVPLAPVAIDCAASAYGAWAGGCKWR